MKTDKEVEHGGGIALYISNEFEFLVTMCGPKELEFLLVSLHNTHNINNAHQKVYIGLWYRPPDKNTALDDLYSVIENLDVAILSSFVLLGDFNIDFCKQSHPLFSKLSIFFTEFCTNAGRPPAYSYQPFWKSITYRPCTLIISLSAGVL